MARRERSITMRMAREAPMRNMAFPKKHCPRLLVLFCVLFPLMLSSCGGGNAAQRKSFIEGLNSEIGFATLDDLITELGPPQQSIETPEGIWYTWRKTDSGAVSGGFSVGFFGISMGAPTETGEELNCLFDRDTGRLRNYNYREW